MILMILMMSSRYVRYAVGKMYVAFNLDSLISVVLKNFNNFSCDETRKGRSCSIVQNVTSFFIQIV